MSTTTSDPFEHVEGRYLPLLEGALMILEQNARYQSLEKLEAVQASTNPERLEDS